VDQNKCAIRNGGDDGTRTRDLCRDSPESYGNYLKRRGTDGYPKPRFGTLGNNYWTMNGPRNELCRRTAEALTKDVPSNSNHPFARCGGGFDSHPPLHNS
jgi:hypothetical protein